MKLIASIFTAILITFGITTVGALPAHATAPTPEDCVESDDTPEGVDCSEVVDGEYPLLLPEEGTVPAPTPPPTVEPTGGLPATGSDSTTSLLQIGGLLLAGGVIVLVLARRRAPAPAA